MSSTSAAVNSSDVNSCGIPNSVHVNLAESRGWLNPAWPVYLFGPLYLVVLKLALFKLLPLFRSRETVPPRRRSVLILLALFANFRALGSIMRIVAVNSSGGPSLAVFILVQVFQASGFLPLIEIAFSILSSRASTFAHIYSNKLGRRFDRYFSTLVFAAASLAITGAAWTGSVAPCTSDTGNLIRNISLWVIATITWLVTLKGINIVRSTGQYENVDLINVAMALLLVVRTTYSLLTTAISPAIIDPIDQAAYYLMSVVPELLFVGPIFVQSYFDTCLPLVDEDDKPADLNTAAANEQWVAA